MQFFTHIDIKPFEQKISHAQPIFLIGSCFAENIAHRLAVSKFHVTSSPTGILFNPESIALSLERMSDDKRISHCELQYVNELWFNYDFHSSFSSADKNKALEAMQSALDRGKATLNESEVVIVTFGTAWVYRKKNDNKVVANCHKQPQSLFEKSLLSVEEIFNHWDKLLGSILKDKQVIFTVSPIRHLSDGLEQNSLSKSILRIAIAELMARHKNVLYFPSFEIMNDELRDYRFYADDMTHPSNAAVEYIWQRFAEVAFTDRSRQLIERIAKIKQAAAHRPFNPDTESYRTFCRKQLEEIEKIKQLYPAIDFSEENKIFVAHL